MEKFKVRYKNKKSKDYGKEFLVFERDSDPINYFKVYGHEVGDDKILKIECTRLKEETKC